MRRAGEDDEPEVHGGLVGVQDGGEGALGRGPLARPARQGGVHAGGLVQHDHHPGLFAAPTGGVGLSAPNNTKKQSAQDQANGSHYQSSWAGNPDKRIPTAGASMRDPCQDPVHRIFRGYRRMRARWLQDPPLSCPVFSIKSGINRTSAQVEQEFARAYPMPSRRRASIRCGLTAKRSRWAMVSRPRRSSARVAWASTTSPPSTRPTRSAM